jgi:hypothetical protein
MDTSKNRALADEEYIASLGAARNASPVINALCERFEALLNKPTEEGETFDGTTMTCPHCEAKVVVADDGDNWILI